MLALQWPNRWGGHPRGGHPRGGHPLISFINDVAKIGKILDYIGIESSPSKISKARGSPLWDACDETEPKEYFDAAPDWDVGQHGPDEDVDQSVNW